MSKRKLQKKKIKVAKFNPDEALQFLEDIRTMASDIDEPRVSISLRVPGNVLRAVKARAKFDGKKYQSLMIEMLRQGLRKP
jgi:predicted DNA binding CopG/RHH family protein